METIKGPAAQAVFTPGPYERTHGDFVYALGRDAEGRSVNRMYLTIHMGWADGKRTTQAELNATAALLQTAPDLYEALLDAARGLESIERNRDVLIVALHKAGLPHSWLEGLAPKLERARAALAKAEGRSAPQAPSEKSP